MATQTRLAIPPAALEWLVGSSSSRVVGLDLPAGILGSIAGKGNRVLNIQHSASGVRRLPGMETMVASAESLPLSTCSVRTVLVSQRLDVRDPRRAHAEISRVLTPGGWVAGWHIARDDSVPWVKRLRELIQSLDPHAMTTTTPVDHDRILASNYFPTTDSESFRLWVPVTTTQLSENITSLPAVQHLDHAQNRDVTRRVREIVSNASSFGTLRLPYHITCWRAMVDHQELTTPITLPESGLRIIL